MYNNDNNTKLNDLNFLLNFLNIINRNMHRSVWQDFPMSFLMSKNNSFSLRIAAQNKLLLLDSIVERLWEL